MALFHANGAPRIGATLAFDENDGGAGATGGAGAGGKAATSDATAGKQDGDGKSAAGDTGGQGDGDEDGAEGEEKLPDTVKELLRKLRRESRAATNELKALRSYKEEREKAELTEAQREKQRADKAEEALQQRRADDRERNTREAIAAVGAKLGTPIRDADAAFRLLGTVGDIEYDDADKPANVEPLVKKLLAARPYLAEEKRKGSADGGDTGAAGAGSSGRDASPGIGTLRNAYANSRPRERAATG